MARMVFIDTNTYLSFYRLSKNDTTEMQKMLHAMSAGELKVLLTDQVVDEYWRNREGVIADALKKFRDGRAPNQYPKLLNGYDELSEIRRLGSELDKLTAKLSELVEDDARAGRLRADTLVEKVFEGSEHLSVTAKILDRAHDRVEKGNPPGKNQSYGDAINWECLLSRVEYEDDLFVISGDGDFASKLEPSKISQFLVREWASEHSGEIKLFDTISSFFKEYYPDIELEIEFEQNRLVDDLLDSGSFRSTHLAIQDLDPQMNFTANQRRRIIEAGLTNRQIYTIGVDEDVQAFYEKFLERHGSMLDNDEWDHFVEHFDLTRPPLAP